MNIQLLRHVKEQIVFLSHFASAVVLTLSCFTATPALAQVECGDSIGPHQTVVLQHDLHCSTATGGITIIGPASLDLDGFAVLCPIDNGSSETTGITLIGKGAALRNGFVRFCRHGVRLGGTGRHVVEGVDSEVNNEDGFVVESNLNILSNNVAFAPQKDGTGFKVSGDHNQLTQNVAHATHGGNGFLIVGKKNRLFWNEAAENEFAGYAIMGDKNQLKQNVARKNVLQGFDSRGLKNQFRQNAATKNGATGYIVYSDQNTLTQNDASENGFDGFDISGQGNTLAKNFAMSNGTDGIRMFGDNNKLLGNLAAQNQLTGIRLSDSPPSFAGPPSSSVASSNKTGSDLSGMVGTLVRNNTALDNNQQGAEAFDLEDDTLNCGVNTWRNNIFGTRNQTCIE
jgi:parallel beta-helix repeat protein